MNITDVIWKQLECRPYTVAVQRPNNRVTYEKLAQSISNIAGGLLELGIEPRVVVAVNIDNPLDHLVSCLAIARIGATAISVSPNMPTNLRSRLFVLTQCKWVIEGSEYKSSNVQVELRVVAWSKVQRLASVRHDIPAYNAADDTWLFATGSGSTGRPKIMPITHRQQLLRASLGQHWLPYGPSEVMLSLVSMYFYASKQRCLEAFALGATVYLGQPNRIDYRQEVASRTINAIYGTVFHIAQLIRQLPPGAESQYKELTALMIGGSTVSMSFRQEIKRRLTQRLYVLWGTNECHTATVTRLSEVFDTIGGVGHPLPGFEVEIVDEQGEPLPSGVEGRLRVASATTINSYLGDDTASSGAFRGSWFYPGDLGCLSPNGQLIYRGRADDLMIVDGINVYPAEIEQCLRSLSGITDTVVTPLKHRVTQDVPVALVVLDHPTSLSPQVILKHVHNELGRHALHGLLVVNKIPRNEQGKVQQELVKEILKKSISRRGEFVNTKN